MSRISLRTPEPFNFKTPDDWPRWKRRFQQFREASGLAGESQSKQVLYCLGEEAESVLVSSNITADELGQYAAVVLMRFSKYARQTRLGRRCGRENTPE